MAVERLFAEAARYFSKDLPFVGVCTWQAELATLLWPGSSSGIEKMAKNYCEQLCHCLAG